MLFAVQRGDVMVVNELATSAAHRLLKENKDGWIPLHDAAFCGQTECMKILLKGMTPDCCWSQTCGSPLVTQSVKCRVVRRKKKN